ncbi:MAG: tape measure protein, partial [Methylococcaceae bacterium]
MSSQSSLVIRISADATQATSVIHGATQAVNNLGVAGNAANSGIASLSGGVQNLGRWSGQTTSAIASMTGGISGLSSQSNTATSSIQRLNQSLTENERASNAAAGSMRSLNSVLGALGVVTGIAGLAQLAKNILQINIEIEALRARLDMTMPSLAAANNAFSLILKIAKETPQSIDEITKAFLLLKNSGLDTSEKSMRGWTDVASKFGGTADMLTGVIRQFGQAMMKGALHAQDANAMIERGIPLYGLLTEVTGKSAGQIIKMMEAGELNNKTMDKALELLFKMSSGSSAKAMETMRGQIEGLGSAWSGFVDVLMGDKSEGMIKNMLGLLSATLEHFTKLMSNSIDAQIADLQEKLSNQKHSFISVGLQKVGFLDSPEQIQTQIASLKAAKQKGIDDIAFMEKDALAKKQAQEIQAQNETNKAIERGDSDAIKKLMSGKLEKMKDYQSKLIEIEAQKYNIPANLPKALASVESTFNNQAISPVGAAGLFQIMPSNLKARGTSTQEILADEKKSVEVGMKMIADVWEKSGYDLQKFWTLWNAGHLRLTKEGVFSMALQPKETQKGMPQLVEAYKQLGGEVSDLAKLEQGHTHALKEAAAEQKHLATESAQAAKKAADEHQQLVEKFNGKDPFKEYAQSMAELRSVQKDLSPETFLLNQQKIAAEFEKNTVDLKAYNDELERHKKYLEHVGDYNSIVAESKNNLTRGAITPQEHGLNVANANASLMNNVADAYPDAKIPKIPVNQASEVIDKKNINESSKELAKFNDQTDKAIEKLNQFGDSGKMAFDGLLGGISAVASAASSFGDAMSKLNTDHAAYAENYNKFMADSTKSESDKAEATKGFAKEKEAYDTKSFQTEINGAMSVAGAAAKMFNQKSVAARAFHGVEMGLAVISMAMSAKKMVVDIAAGAAAMFGQSGWAGFAGVAAMGAVMAGLGVAMTGGSKTSCAIQESTKTTGTVLGDSNKQSESISNITKTLNDISEKQYPELKNITSAVKDLGTAQSSMLINMFRGGGVKLETAQPGHPNDNSMKMMALNFIMFGAAGLITSFVLSKIPIIGDILGGIGKFIGNGLFGKVTQSVVGGGVRINEQTLGSVMDLGVIDGNVVTTIEKKKSSWFKTTRKISEVLSALDDSIASGMGKIFSSMGKATLAYWDYLGLNLTQGIEKLSAYNIPAAFIKTFGLKDDEIKKAFDNYNSMSFDKMIEYMLGGFTKQFQQMGETLAETMNRLMVDATSVKYAFRNAGLETGLTGENLVIFSQQMIGAAGGLKNLTASLDVIANKLTPKSVKTDNAKEDLTKILADTDFIANAKTTSVDTSGFTNVLNSLSKGASLSQAELDKLKTDSLAVIEHAKTAATTASVSTNQFATTKVSNAADMAFVHTGVISAAQKPYMTSLLANPTFGSLNESTTMEEANKLRADVDFNTWRGGVMKSLFGGNSATSAQGHADLAATVGDFSSRKEFDAAKAKAEEAAQPSINLSAETVTAANSIITLIDAMADKSKETQSIQESILKQITSSTETTQRARDIVIAGLDDSEKITGLDSRITTAFAKWAHEHQVAGKDLELTTANLQRFNDALLDTQKLSNASKYMTDFSTSISGWVNNQKVTQLGSTQTQLVNAGKAFDALMLRINLPNSVEDKKLAMSSITQSADAYMNSIKNFYGSSKAGQDLMQGVIDKVSVLPDSVNIQQMIYDKLEEIRSGIVTSPTFSGTLTPENKTVMDNLVTTTKAL